MEHDQRFQDHSPIEPPSSLVPAVIMGLVAALIGGIAWAVIVGVTSYEIGYAAVGVGALVGLAMSRTTPRRDRAAAGFAVTLALAGLVTARVVIAEFVIPHTTVREVLADSELMTEAAIIELASTASFSPALQEQYDAVPYGDGFPDALYADLQAEATRHLQGAGEEERHRLAEQLTGMILDDIGRLELILAQLSLFDLLWVFLAVSTTWKMMTGQPTRTPEEPEPPLSIAG